MREIFKTIVGLLKVIDGQKWVDKDKGQIDNYAEKPSVAFPCYLVKILISTTETITIGKQMCTGMLIVRTVTDLSVCETSAAAPDEAVKRSLAIYDLVDAAFNALQNYTNGEIDSIDRLSCVEEDRRDGLTVFKTTFAVTFIESTAQAAD